MIGAADRQRAARAVLTYLAEPGDPVLAALLDAGEPADIVTAITAGRVSLLPGIRAVSPASSARKAAAAKLDHAFGLWRNRLGEIPSEMELARFRRGGIRLVCPGDPEWPTQLDVLGAARPYAMWLRGAADLRYCCLQSVSVVGARASTAYGAHVGTELAAALAERGWTVISGGAYGIDGCAHRGALAADGVTIAVLACGVDYAYPRGHHDLLAGITAQGVLVSEWPPGRTPTRFRFLIRNRVIAALSRGTVIVEAGLRSGALNTARHARDLGRPLMAVPGPVTSDVSAGCHKIIREWGAVCTTDAHDVLELVTPLGELPADSGDTPAERKDTPAERKDTPADWMDTPASTKDLPAGRTAVPAGGEPAAGSPGERPVFPLLSRDVLDPLSAAVLEAIPARGAGPAVIAVSAGLSMDAVVRSLGLLAAGGFVERCSRGWRIRRSR